MIKIDKLIRKSRFSRTTKETDIRIDLSLDGNGTADIDTGIGFLDHMLTALARHGMFDLTITCDGDLYVDGHHTVEDLAICLGKVFRQAVGNGETIVRYGSSFIPMDEALVHVVLDICGRGYLAENLDLPQERIGDLDSCLIREFLYAFAINAGITLHVRQLAGDNSHHIAEATFKALGHALKEAVNRSLQDQVLSTKGKLDL